MHVLSQKYSKYLEVLGCEERVRILELLADKDMCVQEINRHFYASQATISYHIGLLKEVGFLSAKKEGKYIIYSLATKAIKEYLKGFVKDFSLCLNKV